MKTKDLIKLLQEADPSGEEEVFVGNADILLVQSMPAYYDGSAQLIKRDANGSAISGKFMRGGTKITIQSYGIMDGIYDDPDFPVEYDDWKSEHDEKKVKEWREDSRDIAPYQDLNKEIKPDVR